MMISHKMQKLIEKYHAEISNETDWKKLKLKSYPGVVYIVPYQRLYFLVEGNLFHKTDGPAMIANYGETWYENHSRHRIGGPGFISYTKDEKKYFINDKSFTEQDYWNHPLNVQHKLKFMEEKLRELNCE